MFTEEEKIELEHARKTYAEIKRKKAALTGKYAKLIEQIEAVDIGNYSLSGDIPLMLSDVYSNNFLNASFDMFRLGFMQGQRAERKRAQNGGKK